MSDNFGSTMFSIPPYDFDSIIIYEIYIKVKKRLTALYLIYDKITLRVCKRIFHPNCIKIEDIEIIGRWNI